jgi:hypothetical protein
MRPILPDGSYPFIDQRLPRSDLIMVEAPAQMETILRSQAEANGVYIARGIPVELRRQSAEYPDATFLVSWPEEDEHLHMLLPKRFATGNA